MPDSLFLCELRPLLQVRARTKRGVNLTRQNQRTGRSYAALGADRVNVLAQAAQQLLRNGIASLGPVQEKHSDVSGAWRGDLLHVDDGALGAGSKCCIAADLDVDGDGDRGAAEGEED